jgi:ABC-2 type transport system ATP-binding protein
MCDRVAIIHRGRTLAAGPVRELLERRGGAHRFDVRPPALAAKVLRELSPPADRVVEDGDSVTAEMTATQVPAAVRALDAAGVEIFGIERPGSTLEEVFLEVTGGETV